MFEVTPQLENIWNEATQSISRPVEQRQVDTNPIAMDTKSTQLYRKLDYVKGTLNTWQQTDDIPNTPVIEEQIAQDEADYQNKVNYQKVEKVQQQLVKDNGVPASLLPIEDPMEAAQFKAQIQHESGGKLRTESGYYKTPDRIKAIFGSSRLQGKDPATLVRSSKKLFNTVYGGTWGEKNLGNTEEGDGYKYRGRGLIQITGRANYKKFGELIGVDLEASPDKALEQETAEKIALAYWNTRVKPKVTNFSDTRAVTKLINGGSHGLKERDSLFKKYSK